MRILNTEELRHVYGGHGKNSHGKAKGHSKNACDASTTKRDSSSRRKTDTRKDDKKRKY